ncbi:MAG: glycosyltransferase [Candidatus Omnitrophota bacterium]|jgi:glycosyltransferase involved in cell wall biosynthesis
MNILYISYNGALEPLGQSQVISYLTRLSLKEGLVFTLLTFERENDLRDDKSFEKISGILEENKIEWHRLTYHKQPFLVSTVYDILLGVIYSLRLISKNKISVIHARSYVPAVIACIIKKALNKKIKFIFDMRGMMIDEYAEGGIFKKNGVIYRLGKIIEKRILLLSDRIVVLTERIKNTIDDCDYLKGKKDLKTAVIPCCVDLRKFSPDLPKGEIRRKLGLTGTFIFVYAGSVGTWYFLEGMLDLFKIAKKIIPTAHFLFINRDNAAILKNEILVKGLDGKDFTIIRSGYDDMPYYISECDAGVIFYKQLFSRQACCPVKFGEYLSCGIPLVLNSGIGDTEEIVRTHRIGGIVKEFSEDYYADAINELLEIKKEGPGVKQRCRSVAEKLLSLEIGINKYAGIYKELKET